VPIARRQLVAGQTGQSSISLVGQAEVERACENPPLSGHREGRRMTEGVRGLAVAALLLLAATCQAAEPFLASPDDYRSQQFKNRSRVIDPDQGAYGVPFNASEGEIVKAFGPPNGIYQMSEDRRALLYGKSHAFVLKAGKFKELYLSDHLFDWKFVERIESHPFFDDEAWEIRPGLKKHMDYQAVKALVGNVLGNPKYEATYTTDRATVSLMFATMTAPGQEPPQYQLHSFSIRYH
jgi:hypothetical protein